VNKQPANVLEILIVPLPVRDRSAETEETIDQSDGVYCAST